jgi:rRNA biogenesis protein RRP5
MEGVIDSHPKRTDLWIVYIDLEVVQRDLERARSASHPIACLQN